jgi:serine/threonine protein kinase
MSAPTAAQEQDPLIGKVLDERYRIEEPLGQGGIGKIYKARHLILGRHMAVKVLLAQYESIPALQVRFKREAEALAALSHPNIVTITDFGVAEGMPYLVMELLQGQDLASLCERQIIEPPRALAIVRQMLRALSYAHNRGLVHRDLKPHNVWVRALDDGTDHVEVLDFGLARFMDDQMNRGPKLTKAGALIGTPAYMAPEQASGETVDARADVYAAGIVLFEALTGRKPFESRDPGEILRAHMLSPPPKIVQADPGLTVSDALEALYQRAMAKVPRDRFATAQDMLAALDALGPDCARRTGPRPPPTQPLRTVAATYGGVDQTRAASPSSRRTASSEVAVPKSRLPLLAGLGCLAGVLVGGAIAAAVIFSDVLIPREDAAADAGAGVVEPVRDPATNVVPVDPPEAPVQPPVQPGQQRNPFATDVPTALEEMHARFNRGEDISDSQRRTLDAFFAEHPGDPRPLLLRAHGEANRAQLQTAIDYYEQAWQLDPSSRGYPYMQSDLLMIVRTARAPEIADEAATLVFRVYRVEASAEIEAHLADRTLESTARTRFTALRDRIRSASGGTGATGNFDFGQSP